MVCISEIEMDRMRAYHLYLGTLYGCTNSIEPRVYSTYQAENRLNPQVSKERGMIAPLFK